MMYVFLYDGYTENKPADTKGVSLACLITAISKYTLKSLPEFTIQANDLA
jgi:hypothetical protein